MEKLIEFVSNNYIWFIVVGGVLLLIALILLVVKLIRDIRLLL